MKAKGFVRGGKKPAAATLLAIIRAADDASVDKRNPVSQSLVMVTVPTIDLCRIRYQSTKRAVNEHQLVDAKSSTKSLFASFAANAGFSIILLLPACARQSAPLMVHQLPPRAQRSG